MLVLSAHCENSSGGGTRCIRRAQVPCRDVNRVQMLHAKAEAEAKVKKAEQNTIFHNEK